MTREQKLALIVGFSLMLLVGVLISDHLSRAREARVAAVDAEESMVVRETRPVLPDPTRLIPRTEYAAVTPAPTPSGVVPVEVLPEEPVRERQTAMDGSREAPLAENLAGVPRIEPEPALVEIAQGRYLNQPEEPALEEPASDLAREVADLGGRIVDSVIHLPAAAQTMRPPLPSAVISMNTKITEPVVPEPAWHTVAKGESLFEIAKRYYGDGKHWRKLAEHNRGRVGEDGAVRIGVRLAIPAAETLGIKAVAGAKPEEPRVREPAKKTEPAKPAPKAMGKTAVASYTVQKGDTLGEIAQRLLGSVKRKGELLALNKDRIKDENSIRVGMVLKVPATN